MTATSQEAKPSKPKKIDEALMLLDHGTAPNWFSPGAIIQAAENDLKTRAHNKRVKFERQRAKSAGIPTDNIENARSFAFIAKHVRDAKTSADIIRAAIKDAAKGQASSKVNTARLYRNVENLKLALARLEARP